MYMLLPLLQIYRDTGLAQTPFTKVEGQSASGRAAAVQYIKSSTPGGRLEMCF